MQHIKQPFQTKLFIGGKFVDAVSGKTFPVINPATEEVITHVAEADKADVDLAVAAAQTAFASWKHVDCYVRRDLLWKLADLLEQNQAEFASLETLDNGKPLCESAGDIGFGIKVLRFYAGFADKVYGKVCPAEGNHFNFTKHQPIGVCGQIVPWNYPLMLAIWKIGAALCTGNCVVIKAAEQTPLATLRFANLVQEAGFPDGVLNILTGFGPTAGAAIASHPDIRKISFTGSTAVGRLIAKMAAESNLKRVTLELGGKSPLVVCDDADLDHAVATAILGVFFNQGQVCTASGRVFVQAGLYDKFAAKMTEVMTGRKQGDGFEEGVLQGPLVSERQMNTVLGYIEKGKAEGAKLVLGGGRLPRKGYFVEPTIFTNVTDDMTIAREEIFGPVMVLLKFDTVDEVIERANKTKYGLGSGILTNNIGDIFKFINQVEAGMVWVNTWDTCDVSSPFGGVKESGFGKELSAYSIEEYTSTKSVMWAIPNPPVRN